MLRLNRSTLAHVHPYTLHNARAHVNRFRCAFEHLRFSYFYVSRTPFDRASRRTIESIESNRRKYYIHNATF